MADRDEIIAWLHLCDGHAIHMGHGCEKCPFLEGTESGEECVERLHAAAVSLLNAQKPRVMTLEDLKAYLLIDENGRFPEGYGWEELAQRAPIYIEPRNPTPGVLYWWTAERLRAWVLEPYFQERYGKVRMAWTSRPTDEQREKVKWDE